MSAADRRIADVLTSTIDAALPKAENKIWHRHQTRDQAKAGLFDYVERLYNPYRRHSTIG